MEHNAREYKYRVTCKCSPKQRVHLEELGTDGRIRDYWNVKKLDGSVWNGLICHSIQKMTGILNREDRFNKTGGFPD